MTPLSNTLAWKIPWTEEPGRATVHGVTKNWTGLMSVGFFRQEYWNEVAIPFSGGLPNPGMEPRSPTLQADSLPAEPPGKPGKCSE